MAEELTAAPDGETTPPPRTSAGRGLAAFALLLALAAIGGVAWLHYTLVIDDPDAGMARRLAVLQSSQAELRAEFENLAGQRQAALDALRADIIERQQAFEDKLAASAGGHSVPAPQSERQWKLAEAEFLLRAANHWAHFERDAGSATELLSAADSILEGLTEPAALRVRTAIAAEILNLRKAEVADPAAIHMRLDAIKGQLTGLARPMPAYAAVDTPLAAGPEGTATEDPAPAGDGTAGIIADTGIEDTGFFAMLGRELGGLVRFRRIETTLERPPHTTESALIEINLRLMLEQAQLAALKRDQAVYASSLNAAQDWIRAWLDGRDNQVRETVEVLETLRLLDLEAPLPDISGSLDELRKARRQQS